MAILACAVCAVVSGVRCPCSRVIALLEAACCLLAGFACLPALLLLGLLWPLWWLVLATVCARSVPSLLGSFWLRCGSYWPLCVRGLCRHFWVAFMAMLWLALATVFARSLTVQLGIRNVTIVAPVRKKTPPRVMYVHVVDRGSCNSQE